MRLTVIGTFYGRHENSFPLMKRLLVDSTYKPDEVFLMCEEEEDLFALVSAYHELFELELTDSLPSGFELKVLPTPRLDGGGGYSVIPYSNKINEALNHSTGDVIVYLDNNSDPKPEKYETMLFALEQNPEWGAVYCTQKRTGMTDVTFHARELVGDGYCQLNYTQVMHRRTEDRWPLDISLANPDLADGVFWRQLHRTLGDFHPVGGDRVLDEHRIDHPYATGVVT